MANRWWEGSTAVRDADPVVSDSSHIPSLHLLNPLSNDSDPTNNNYNPPDDSPNPTTSRTRGRPHGSKNKPAHPIIIARDSPNSLRSHVLEISSGFDILEAITTFSRRHQRGLTVISASGVVLNVTLRQPAAPPGAVFSLHGRFDILSLSGVFLPPPSPLTVPGFTIYLAGSQGQVMGGSLVGELLASGPVMVIVATFSNAAYDRLPLEEEEVAATAPTEVEGLEQFAANGSAWIPVCNLPPNLMPNGQLPHDMFAAAAAWAPPPPPSYQ